MARECLLRPGPGAPDSVPCKYDLLPHCLLPPPPAQPPPPSSRGLPPPPLPPSTGIPNRLCLCRQQSYAGTEWPPAHSHCNALGPASPCSLPSLSANIGCSPWIWPMSLLRKPPLLSMSMQLGASPHPPAPRPLIPPSPGWPSLTGRTKHIPSTHASCLGEASLHSHSLCSEQRARASFLASQFSSSAYLHLHRVFSCQRSPGLCV